jgi:hypothetical protein
MTIHGIHRVAATALRFRNRVSGVFLFGCVSAVATVAAPQYVLAQTVTTTICKQTSPSPDPWSTSFKFTGANSWASGPNSFTTLYTPSPLATNPFSLKDGQCITIDITHHDKFNKFAESPVPPGWALTNISCNYTKSVVSIIGANPNRAFQPGDNTVTIEQADATVKCTFVNTLACFAPSGTSLPPCTQPGQPVSLDLSTLAYPGSNGIVDPNWTVAPGGPPTSIVNTSGPWNALPNNWVEPTQAKTAATYTYTRPFNLPCSPQSYTKLELAGFVAADNSVQLKLNACTIASCQAGNANGICFNVPATGTPIVSPPSTCFNQGPNALVATVWNQAGTATALSVKALLSATCGRDCVCGCPPGTISQDGKCVPVKNQTGKTGHQTRPKARAH